MRPPPGHLWGEYNAGHIFGTESDEELNASFALGDATYDEGEEDFDFDQ